MIIYSPHLPHLPLYLQKAPLKKGEPLRCSGSQSCRKWRGLGGSKRLECLFHRCDRLIRNAINIVSEQRLVFVCVALGMVHI